MQASQIPAKFLLAWAENAGASYINSIPQTSQIGVNAGRASLNDGFPPLNFLPVGSGGVPPFGGDFNGILNQVTAWSQWQNAGAQVAYDSAFSTAIGGYPKGAILASTTAGLLWLNTVDNNTTNPDSGGTGWVAILTGTASASTQKAPKLIGATVGGSGTSLPTSANTLLPMAVTQNNLFGTSTWASNQLTVGAGEAGLWAISAFCWFPAGAASYQSVGVWHNGSQALVGTSTVVSGSGGVANISGVLKLAVGDTVYFEGYQQSGSTQATAGQGASLYLISAY